MENKTLNRLPTVITETGVYLLRDGTKAIITEIKDNTDKGVTRFHCKGSIEKMFRGKMCFRGYHIWHESGRSLPVTESHSDIVKKVV